MALESQEPPRGLLELVGDCCGGCAWAAAA